MQFSDIIRSYTSRQAARDSLKKGERVVRAGTFANGSFGLYAPLRSCGIPVGGPNPLITVWHVVAKATGQ